jgi:hypothetical protein
MKNSRFRKKPLRIWLDESEFEALNKRLNREINTEQNMTEIGDIILTAKLRGDLE